MNEKLSQAIKSIKSGDKQTGYRYLVEVIDASPKSKDAENAWLWMSTIVDGTERKRMCLETVLSLNPNNTYARKGLSQLSQSSSLEKSAKSPQIPVYNVTPLDVESGFLNSVLILNISVKEYIWAYLEMMGGIEFEHTVCALLENQGFDARVTQASGDLGVDILAVKDEVKYAIQVKMQNKPVSRRAVSDAVAGREHYNCDIAMVITSSDFSEGARELANSTRCKLVGRETLDQWLVGLQTYLLSKDMQEISRIAKKNLVDFDEYAKKIADYFNLAKGNDKLVLEVFASFLDNLTIHLGLLTDVQDFYHRIEPDINPELHITVKEAMSALDGWNVQLQNLVARWKKELGIP